MTIRLTVSAKPGRDGYEFEVATAEIDGQECIVGVSEIEWSEDRLERQQKMVITADVAVKP